MSLEEGDNSLGMRVFAIHFYVRFEQKKMEPMWYVYVAKCKDSTFYTGITTNIERRFKQHNGLLAGGARYTSARRPVELVYCEQAPDRAAASKREYQVRKLPRPQKQQLVQRYITEAENGQAKTTEA